VPRHDVGHVRHVVGRHRYGRLESVGRPCDRGPHRPSDGRTCPRRAAAGHARRPGRCAIGCGREPVAGRSVLGDACLFDHCTGSGRRRRYRECRRPRPQPIGASSWPPCVTAAALRGKFVRQMPMGPRSHGRPTDSSLPYRCRPTTAARVRHHDAARRALSRSICKADQFRIGLLSDLPGISAYLFQGIVHRLRYRRHILDGDRRAASARRFLDARRYRDRDVGGFDRGNRRRRPHPRRLGDTWFPRCRWWASCCPFSPSNWPKRSHACGGLETSRKSGNGFPKRSCSTKGLDHDPIQSSDHDLIAPLASSRRKTG